MKNKIWVLPILSASLFAVTAVLVIVLSARTSATITSLGKSSYPNLDIMTQFAAKLDNLIGIYQEAVAEGDAKRLEVAHHYVEEMTKLIDQQANIENKGVRARQLKIVFTEYHTHAETSAKMLLSGSTEHVAPAIQKMQVALSSLQSQVRSNMQDARDEFSNHLSTSMSGVRAVLMSVLASAVSAILILFVGWQLQTTARKLKAEIAKRQELQGQLLTTARQAGMAEIAINVLHNVGNTLNSVNICASLVTQRVMTSKTKNLVKAVQMFEQHKPALNEFLTQDEKGKLLPDYLLKLADALQMEQKDILQNMSDLAQSVEHIKAIIATQQTHATKSQLIEASSVNTLVEDALRVSDAELANSNVEVHKDFAAVPMVMLDKGRTLQILVHLISNAKHAMAGKSEPRILRINTVLVPSGTEASQKAKNTQANLPTLKISIQDTGIGIPEENLANIFVHGFTTRKDGHGFGLHSSANAAKEMGGKLTAHSKGLHQGATFVLEIPVEIAKEVVY